MRNKRLFAAALCVLTAFSAAAPAFADDGRVHIKSAEELRELARKCRSDSYSEGLTVYLDRDIDLSGEPFEPFASFSGSFYGKGHTVSGVELATDGTNQGFFRYIQEGGLVKELKLSGTVSPENIRRCVGGIAGSNYGTIEGCSYTGSVRGLEKTGGIAGYNFGTVKNCSFSGTVSGKRYTGGITGYNDGTVQLCTVMGEINTAIETAPVDIDEINITDLTELSIVTADDSSTVTDSGGIAGMNTGVISGCVNEALVGYPHYGYNIGGISGRSCGFVSECENRGEIRGRKDTGGVVGQMEPYMSLSSTDNLIDELKHLSNAIGGAMSNLDANSSGVGDVINGLASEAGNAVQNVQTAGSQISVPTPAPGGTFDPNQYAQDVQNAFGTLSGSMGNISGYIAALNGTLSGTSSQLARDMQVVNHYFYRSVEILGNIMNGENVRYRDISDEDLEENTEGKVYKCVNNAPVDGDSCVGGIAGDMGVELEFDLEGVIGSTLDVNITSSIYESRCVVRECVNNGSVTGKKSNVGGVAGYTEQGTVIGCEGYGSVKSEGSYVGGVVGRSDTVVRESYAMCSVSGKEYVGGIAGSGVKIRDCGSRVSLSASAAAVGAIAGSADVRAADEVDETDELYGSDELLYVRGNSYVSDTLGGVDGVSYTGRAQQLTDREFFANEAVPARFRTVKLSFTVDGVKVAELEGEYGRSIDESLLPPVPEREGFTGYWSECDLRSLSSDMTVEAVYRPDLTSIAAGNVREGGELSVLLLNGSFSDGASVELCEYGDMALRGLEGSVLEIWEYTLVNDVHESDSYSVRYLTPEPVNRRGCVVIYTLEGDSWHRADTRESGSYTVFDGRDGHGVFAAVEFTPDYTLLYVICTFLAGAGFTVAGIIIYRIRAQYEKQRG